jgi:hypothetical protein
VKRNLIDVVHPTGASLYHTIKGNLKLGIPLPGQRAEVTGWHVGEIKPGDVLRLTPMNSYEIIEVLERRDHKGRFALKDEFGVEITEDYKRPVFNKKTEETSFVDDVRPVNDTSKTQGSFFRIIIKS